MFGLFGLLKKLIVGERDPYERSSKRYETLTPWECRHIARGKCCDCLKGTLYEGPHGGLSVNVACGDCGSEFNLTQLQTGFIFGDRISDRGPRDLGDRACVYGLDKEAA